MSEAQADKSGKILSPEQFEISLGDLIVALWTRRWLIIAFTFLGLVGGALIAFLSTPIYRATVVLAPVELSQNRSAISGLAGQLGGLAGLAGISIPDGSESEEAIATLLSRSFTERFIVEQELMRSLFAERWDSDREVWRIEEDENPPTLADGFALVNNSIRSVIRDRDTGLISVHVDWTDPELSAAWANSMVERVNQFLRERAVKEAEQSIDYLNQELAKTSVVEMRSAVYRLMESQIQKIMLANVREEYAFKVIDPAVAAELDDYYRPNRPLLVALGLPAGFFIGSFLSLGLAVLSRLR